MTSLTYNRRGFTFTEVMFAVILLGIGFIMLAGMFPVAIQQTQTNVEESTASTVVQVATHAMEQTLTLDDVRPTIDLTVSPFPAFFRLTERSDNAGNMLALNDQSRYLLWDKLRGNFILSQDPRFAWTALYKRNPGDNFAQVIIFACQSRNYPNYGPLDLEQPPNTSNAPFLLATLEPRYLPAILSDGGVPGEVDIIEFYAPDQQSKMIRDGPNGPQNDEGALTEGCFVVVSNDGVTTDDGGTPYFDPGYANGRIYRIGSRRPDLDGKNPGVGPSKAYELIPGHDMQSPEENLPLRKPPHGTPVSPGDYGNHQNQTPATVFIVGRGFINPRDGDYSVTGFAQDIAVYTTFIRLK
ncbi:MAG TPA: prepilin-type N-terminal cleavage/methylation domain-containing protein [Tepidisphaeraceae bacterium]|jgi:prepilin-type N-terminal cleavage/methylation domain-containing protein|nr:prepilin-type N-terminal cleavage/methylation domain-containing protein [Tepidisphaeraceae bacterium]